MVRRNVIQKSVCYEVIVSIPVVWDQEDDGLTDEEMERYANLSADEIKEVARDIYDLSESLIPYMKVVGVDPI
jgi:hypothetical protein